MTNERPETRWLDDDEQRSWRAYLRGSRLLEAALDRDLQDHGVQLSEYEIMSMLSEHPQRRLRMSEIAALVVQSRSRLTHTAARLEKRGFVRREPCEGDRRGVELVLTDAGLAAVEGLLDQPAALQVGTPGPLLVLAEPARLGPRRNGAHGDQYSTGWT